HGMDLPNFPPGVRVGLELARMAAPRSSWPISSLPLSAFRRGSTVMRVQPGFAGAVRGRSLWPAGNLRVTLYREGRKGLDLDWERLSGPLSPAQAGRPGGRPGRMGLASRNGEDGRGGMEKSP